jgi:hypothetical protein
MNRSSAVNINSWIEDWEKLLISDEKHQHCFSILQDTDLERSSSPDISHETQDYLIKEKSTVEGLEKFNVTRRDLSGCRKFYRLLEDIDNSMEYLDNAPYT